MSSLVRHPFTNFKAMAAISGAILATMFVTALILSFAKKILGRIGPQGVDAATRIVGFFVSAMGMGLIFHGLLEVLQQYGAIAKP
jgi:multiple antibiotic resistance protein